MKRIGDDRCTVRDYIEIAITIAITYIIIMSGVRITMVIGQSMLPTLREYSIHILIPDPDPDVGDIVAIADDGYYVTIIKRIVAGPGDTVDHWGEPLTLGPGEYYVMGDNRDNSLDSRVFGPINGADIVGRLVI